MIKQRKLLGLFCILILLTPAIFAASSITQPAPQSTLLIVKKVPLKVDGKLTTVFRIEQPDGTWGYHGIKGQDFDATVKNTTDKPTVIHWHGLIVPNNQDGVPYVTQPPIPPGGSYHYHFKLLQAGTFWMHSHFNLQLQQYLSAPFIIVDPQGKKYAQEITLFLADYSHLSPEKIFYDLQHSGMSADMDMSKMPMGAMKMDSGKNTASGQMAMGPDLNDVTYDAYLTNYHTLKQPEVYRVQPGETIRLRIINGAAGSNFFINLGKLTGAAIALDGEYIKPMMGSRFQLAMGQRIDIVIHVPAGNGVYPILAQGEGRRLQTGVILATHLATIPPVSEQAATVAPALDYTQELQAKSLSPMTVKSDDETLYFNLEGDMVHYIWKINHQVWPTITPQILQPGKRIGIVFDNKTAMAHPMHLHGHTFELIAINGKPIQDGALHDTILVLPHTTVKVQFVSNNPGRWMLHCHMLYHQESGMMTLVDYAGWKPLSLKSM